MKLQDASLQVNEKNSFTHSPSCILPSFSKNTSRLLLPKSLWKCASTISFRKYKRVTCNLPVQKQPLRGVLKKTCSGNMLPVYRRTPMLKCEISLWQECSLVNLLQFFRTPFSRNTSWWLLLLVQLRFL